MYYGSDNCYETRSIVMKPPSNVVQQSWHVARMVINRLKLLHHIIIIISFQVLCVQTMAIIMILQYVEYMYHSCNPCPLQVPAVTLLDSTERLIRNGFVPTNKSQLEVNNNNLGEKE